MLGKGPRGSLYLLDSLVIVIYVIEMLTWVWFERRYFLEWRLNSCLVTKCCQFAVVAHGKRSKWRSEFLKGIKQEEKHVAKWGWKKLKESSMIPSARPTLTQIANIISAWFFLRIVRFWKYADKCEDYDHYCQWLRDGRVDQKELLQRTTNFLFVFLPSSPFFVATSVIFFRVKGSFLLL